MRATLFLAGLTLLVLVSCGGEGAGDTEALKAVRAVFRSPEFGYSGQVPPLGEDFECVIPGGGPAPGMRLAGKCRWDAERGGEAWTVSYAEGLAL